LTQLLVLKVLDDKMSSGALATNDNFEEYVTSIKTKSEDLIKTIFPQKITELNAILESEQFSYEAQKTILNNSLNIPLPNSGGAGDAGGQVLVPVRFGLSLPPSGPVTCNPVVATQINVVKPYIRHLVEHANLLKMWVTFLIPKIEDGNNFGVSIQEEILHEIMIVEKEAESFQQSIANYLVIRGKTISKVMKYPQLNDYRQVVTELDEKEFVTLRMILSEIRNRYATMYDLIGKNWEKIIRPRNSNADSLY